ncbi:MAG: HAMP domain-containing histidine kinase [Desulfosarcina sp.]|nr:HAMP domain-containing histidine kinase [Desulfosarcina sp.]MBC2743652.1 HAMP domain-containing histidine kinase [Desulfosarcina sp.]MBC2766561.1 HAMP domain-containing histidine kinase [Desulfosarcina sp.]
MTSHRFKRLFHSVFTKLLMATLAAGLAITFTVIAGFLIIRFHTENAFERNLLLYTEYLVEDLGDPPDENRAQEIARRTGMVIRFDHTGRSWQTGRTPRSFNLDRAWIHHHASGLWMGSSKGHHFIRLTHGGGELTFIAIRDARHGEHAIWILAAMALAMCTILGASYFYIRKILNPLHTLKAGVDEVGAGKLDHRIPETGHGELRDLAQAFNTMAERLSKLLHSKEQLLLDVSHELRSPITRLKVQLEFLDDAALRESLRSDVIEMEAMVTTLLESARLRHAAAALNLKTIDMGDLIRSLALDFKDRLPGVKLGPLVDEPVKADPDKMKIVFRNLLDNGLKHTPEDEPAVSISMAQKPDSLEIVVEDRGEGIPASELPHLFEPFYRPDVSRSRKTGGYGLGLSLCKAIVDAHGGTIDLVSTLGKGTRVTVTLPRS